MTNWQKRAGLLGLSLVLLTLACVTALQLFNDNIIFFLSPTELQTKADLVQGKEFRIGGLVKEGSVEELEPGVWHFVVTDMENEVIVNYRGSTPGLFKEGQGVVALGTLGENGEFQANEVLAKHDENYMPKEVAEALKKSGRWQQKETPPPYADPNKPPFDVYGSNTKLQN